MESDVEPLSPALRRKDFKPLAKIFRTKQGYHPLQQFDPLRVLENNLPKQDSTFRWQVIDKKDWEKGEEIHAYYDILENTILIRSDVYEGAYHGNGRDRFTITHEISHYLLIRYFGCPLYLPRRFGAVQPSQNPEYQANAFAGYLLYTEEMLQTAKGPGHLMELAGTSRSSAEYAIDLHKREQRKLLVAHSKKGGKKPCRPKNRSHHQKKKKA